MKNVILQGDALTKLKELPEKSINMCMTSPPYWALRDYGENTSNVVWGGDKDCEHDWTEHIKKPCGGKGSKNANVGSNKNDFANMRDHDVVSNYCSKCHAWKGQLGLEPTFDQYISNLCDIFEEVKRVLRDDGTCWVNLGDTYYGSGKGAGGNGKNKESFTFTEKEERTCNHCGKKFQGWKFQNFCGSACSGVDNTPRNKKGKLPDKTLTMIPMRFAIEMVNRGWILRNTIIWHKPNAMPSSATDRFTVDFEYIFLFSKQKKYYFETQREPHLWADRDKRSKVVGGVKSKGKSATGNYATNKVCYHPDGRTKRTVWSITTKANKEAHFATYPEELCETPIKAGCPEGGIVLDPFFGSGTTGIVALKQKKNYLGIEINPEYIEIAEKRLKPFKEQTTLNLNSMHKDFDKEVRDIKNYPKYVQEESNGNV